MMGIQTGRRTWQLKKTDGPSKLRSWFSMERCNISEIESTMTQHLKLMLQGRI